MKHCAILLAGGKGSRMNSPGMDKLLDPINNTNAFRLSYEAFLGSKKIDNVLIVYRDNKQKDSLYKQIDIAHNAKARYFNAEFYELTIDEARSKNPLVNFDGTLNLESKTTYYLRLEE